MTDAFAFEFKAGPAAIDLSKIARGSAAQYNNHGVELFRQRKFVMAVEAFKIALERGDEDARTLMNLGAAYHEIKLYSEAYAALVRSDELRPDHPQTLNNLAGACVKLGRFLEAELLARRVLQMEPESFAALTALGAALWGQDRLDEGIAVVRQLVKVGDEPGGPVSVAHKNLGIMLLLKGEFEEGWREYDWRWPADKLPPPHDMPMPFWDGKASPVLVWCEQGAGDEVLHASMIPTLRERGIKVVLECDHRLVPLFRRSFPGVHVFETGDGCAERVRAHIPAGSLGRFVRNSAAEFPTTPGYLKADPARVAELRAQLPGPLRVGISWSSTNQEFANSKSTALAEWGKILGIPGITFVDLQYGNTADAVKAMPHLKRVPSVDLTFDLDGVAALIEACDLVITVSNTVAHLAGALGKPTWTLLTSGISKFWSYGPDPERTIWYPSMRLFRKRGGDWTSALREVETALWEKIWAAPEG